MPRPKLETHQKAFRLNMDGDKYGTVAEIGAGQEVETMTVAPQLKHLHAFLVENRFIEGLDVLDQSHLSVFPRDVLALIQSGKTGWEALVPDRVAELIKGGRLLGYREPA